MGASQARDRIELLVKEWASEVAPRLRSIKHVADGTLPERFACDLGRGDTTSELAAFLYVIVDESRQSEVVFPNAPTELPDGPRADLARNMKMLIGDVQTAAATFDVQKTIHPEDFACLADEIAIGFSESLRWFRVGGFLHGFLMEGQLSVLSQLDEHFSSFSGQHHADLWTEEAIQSSPTWARVRVLAHDVLVTLGVR